MLLMEMSPAFAFWGAGVEVGDRSYEGWPKPRSYPKLKSAQRKLNLVGQV